MINRWFVVDLRKDASLVAALTASGLDVYVLDWGMPSDEDRYLRWHEVQARVRRAIGQVKRRSGQDTIGLMGYCMGGTLASIAAATFPEKVAALVNLAGPIDFSEAGELGRMVDARWFDADAIADAGNVNATQMQSGFSALRPTLSISKWIRAAEIWDQPKKRLAFRALEAWASDNIPFPGEAYRTYIKSLYQGNELVLGAHRVAGECVDLNRIEAPVLVIVAKRDTICPPPAAIALTSLVGSSDTEVLEVPGGHVGAVVGSRAAEIMYPRTADWLLQRLN